MAHWNTRHDRSEFGETGENSTTFNVEHSLSQTRGIFQQLLLLKQTLLWCHVPDTHTIWYHSWYDPIVRCSLQFHRGIFLSYETISLWRMLLLNRYGLEHTSLMRQSSLFPRLKSPNSVLLPEGHTHTTRQTRFSYLKIQLGFQPGLNISIIVWAAS